MENWAGKTVTPADKEVVESLRDAILPQIYNPFWCSYSVYQSFEINLYLLLEIFGIISTT